MEQSYRRRTVLRTGTVGTVLTLPGCSFFSSESEGSDYLPPLANVQVVNRHPEPHSAHVEVRRDGTRIYQTTKTLDAAEVYGQELTIDEPWEPKQGLYTLVGTVNSSHSQSKIEFGTDKVDRTDADGFCFDAHVIVTPARKVEIVYGLEPCASPGTRY
ncbi:hypothetical protein SAMN05421858_3354 [Haladaptatus litoreus]|uniref:Uncharacterized protein n=1 Tax=Haladaptatus litoreus TaxID=553468 RepID=A0A1N7CYU5_9EURY|nr:hypothetical protein SAMN05421858_3354 [Haladaptatus litoreus]